MRKLLLAGALLVIGLDVAWHGVLGLLEAIDRSTYKRVLADARSVVTVLEAYKAATGSYPTTWSADELAKMVAPTYIQVLDTREMRYFSDGTSYVLLMGFPRGSYQSPRSWGGPIEVRDGIVRSAPAWLKIAPSGRLRPTAVGVQPNQRLAAPHSGVTALAQGRKLRATGRARQAWR